MHYYDCLVYDLIDRQLKFFIKAQDIPLPPVILAPIFKCCVSFLSFVYLPWNRMSLGPQGTVEVFDETDLVS